LSIAYRGLGRTVGGYRVASIETVQRIYGWTLEIVLRSDDAPGFQVLPKRWIVERTSAWSLTFRRLSNDYEYYPVTSTGRTHAALTRLMLRCLAQT